MNIEERVAEAIRTYNKVINVMSPNTVYMGKVEYMEARKYYRGVAQPMVEFMGMTVVSVELVDYLQVARV